MPDVMLDDYGAKGDGRTDDLPAVERAKKVVKGGKIHLSAGKVYRMSKSPVFFDGEGQIVGAMGAHISVDSDPGR